MAKNNEKILKKAIEKALDNGLKWKDGWDEVELMFENPYELIFSHDFARAFSLWLIKDRPQLVREILRVHINIGPQSLTEAALAGIVKDSLLRQMVVEEEPLKYLGKFLEK